MVERSVNSTYNEVLYSPIGKTASMSGLTTVNYSYLPLPGGARCTRQVPPEATGTTNTKTGLVLLAVAAFYVALIPGVWDTPQAAGEAAAGSTDGQSIATNIELSGNIYQMPNGKYSWTLPGQRDSDSSPFDPTARPDGTFFAGSYHDHGAFDLNYNSEQFSPNGCNGGLPCDIGLGMSNLNQGQLMFLGTPAGRIEMFDPSQFGAMPFSCVLSGSALSAAPGTGTSSVNVSSCH